MITKLNLASQPFRNRTLPWAITVIVASASLLALSLIIVEGRKVSTQADAVERDLRSLRAERDAFEAQATAVRESVPPDQLQILDAAHLLVDRKRFAWSRLFADLEASLPPGVRMSRISVRDVVQRGGQTRAELELTVVERRPDEVTQMIAEWDRAGVFFGAVPVTQNPPKGRGETGTEWTLRVSYAPRPGTLPLPPAVEGTSRDSGGANVAASASSSEAPTNSNAEAQ